MPHLRPFRHRFKLRSYLPSRLTSRRPRLRSQLRSPLHRLHSHRYRREIAARTIKIFNGHLRVLPATLGNEAGIIGNAALALDARGSA